MFSQNTPPRRLTNFSRFLLVQTPQMTHDIISIFRHEHLTVRSR